MRAGAVEAGDFDQHILDLAAMRARVHAQRAADRARHAAQEREAVDPRLRRRLGHGRVERGGAGDHAMVRRRLDRAESAAAEADHDAAHAAVAHDEVGADADDGDGNLSGKAASR